MLQDAWNKFQQHSPKWWWKMAIYHGRTCKKSLENQIPDNEGWSQCAPLGHWNVSNFFQYLKNRFGSSLMAPRPQSHGEDVVGQWSEPLGDRKIGGVHETQSNYPTGSMGRTVYLPTWKPQHIKQQMFSYTSPMHPMDFPSPCECPGVLKLI